MTTEVKKDLSRAYAAMMQMPAWKDLERWANEERDESMRQQDVTPAEKLNINMVCEARGIRKGIYKIIQHANQCKEGI